jgi:nudix-type nucleoside diphosphatase (YffH/AdpP family)
MAAARGVSDSPVAAKVRMLQRETKYAGFTRIEVVTLEQIRLDGTTMRLVREVETHGDGAAVLPVDPIRKTAILVRQLRVPVSLNAPDDAFVLEAIAGLIDKVGEDPAVTARREALEEAGLALTQIAPAGAAYSTPGLSTEKIHLFLAEADFARDRVNKGGGLAEEAEDIEVVELPLATLAAMADMGEIRDFKTLALIQTLRLRRPDLFV